MQRKLNGEIVVTFSSANAKERVLKFSALKIDDQICAVQDIDCPLVYLTIYDAPFELSDLAIIKRLAPFCQLLLIAVAVLIFCLKFITVFAIIVFVLYAPCQVFFDLVISRSLSSILARSRPVAGAIGWVTTPTNASMLVTSSTNTKLVSCAAFARMIHMSGVAAIILGFPWPCGPGLRGLMIRTRENRKIESRKMRMGKMEGRKWKLRMVKWMIMERMRKMLRRMVKWKMEMALMVKVLPVAP